MRHFGFIRTGLLLATPAFATAAFAQEDTEITTPGAQISQARAHLITPVGANVSVGGGVSNFFRESVRDITAVSGNWEARLGVGSRFFVGGELAYIGGVRAIDSAGLAGDAMLIDNGGEAVVRLNAPLEWGPYLFEPFAFGGIGWRHFALQNANNTSNNIANSDDVGTIPLGLGFAFGYSGLLADARFTYRPTFDDNQLVRATDGRDSDLQSWALSANIGFEF